VPFLLYVLAVAVFVQATSEFMLAGLVTEIAADLGVSVPAAGSLTSAFAIGMVVGAPLMALGVRRLPPRTALAAFLSAFIAAHVVGALAPAFPLLAATRVLAALANAGFLAVALSVAVRVAPADRTARATAVLLAGTTLALIAGSPAGAALGQLLGWRATFWAVALLSVPGLVGVLVGVPAGHGAAEPTGGLRRAAAALRRPPVVLILLAAALVNGGTFAVHTFTGPLLTGAAGLSPSVVPLGLALFGFGAFGGVTLAGRFADTHHRPLLGGGCAALAAGWVLLALLAGSGWLAVVLVGLVGAVGFAVGATAIARSLALAADAGTLGAAATTAALNVGATAGPLLGGWSLTVSPVGPAWVAAALAALAAVPVAGALRRPRSGRPARRSTRAPCR
jgi:MFS transporter, DHA1 family, chloramphenicol resistance protein